MKIIAWFFFLLMVLFTNSLFAKEAKRIIALSPHSVEMLFAIGAGDRILGTVEYADYPEAAKSIPRVGNYAGIQIERVMALQPDLIVAWRSGNKETDLNRLESLGFNVFYTHPANIAAISTEVLKLGQLTGLNRSARRVAKEVADKHKKIIQSYKGKRSVDVFYQLWDKPLRSVGANSWIDSLISSCNGKNIFHEVTNAYPIVSLEAVLSKDPEVIVIPFHDGKWEAKKEIWAPWQKLDAVKNNRVFAINGDLLHRFSPRVMEGLVELCQSIDRAR